jgi:hypothetical protein
LIAIQRDARISPSSLENEMKRLNILLAVLLLVPALSFAKDNTTPIGCKSASDIPGDFVNKCALAGGDETRCSGGTPMCCKKDGKGGTHCYDNPDDVKRKGPKASGASQPTPGTVAPTPGMPKTAPKQPAPGKVAPAK